MVLDWGLRSKALDFEFTRFLSGADRVERVSRHVGVGAVMRKSSLSASIRAIPALCVSRTLRVPRAPCSSPSFAATGRATYPIGLWHQGPLARPGVKHRFCRGHQRYRRLLLFSCVHVGPRHMILPYSTLAAALPSSVRRPAWERL